MAGLQPAHGAHGIELTLRQQYRRYVGEVAQWMPGHWRSPVNWVKRLLDLPALQHLLAGAAAPAWMQEDPELRRFALDMPAARVQALQSSDCVALIEGWRRGVPLYTAWLDHWRSLWPEAPRLGAALNSLARLWLRQIGALSLASQTTSAPLHQTLGRELNYAFRRHSFQPAAAFAHLGLVALDLQRLRAQLLQRALFAATAESP